MGEFAEAPAATGWQTRYFTIWVGQAASLLGSQLVQFALIWHLARQTNSGSALAVAGLMGVLPQAALAPLIGALVDRWNRRAIMLVSDTAIALATLLLALLFAAGAVQLWQIYLLLLVRSIGEGFHASALGASTVLLAPRDQLARLQGLNQALRGGMEVLAAPLGALLLAALPLQGILAIDIATAALAVGPLLRYTIPQPVRAEPVAGLGGIWREIGEGLRYVLRWRGLVSVLAMVTLVNFFMTPTLTLLPLLVIRHFGGGALELGALNAGAGAGVIAGGLLLGLWGGSHRRIITAQLGLAGLGLATALVGAAPAWLWLLALAANFAAGMLTPITNGSYGAILQAVIPPELQGRVFALVMSAAMAIAPVGLLVAGPAADLLGVRAWFVLAGAACAGMGLLGLCIPAVMQLEAQAQAPTQP